MGKTLTHCGLFAGIGGFEEAIRITGGGITTKQLVEIDPDAQQVLRDKYPGIPIHSDIRDYHCSYGEFDLFTISFPCTGTSHAGTRTGLEHSASSLWFEALRCIREGKPRFIIIEQPEGIINQGLRAVLGGLRMAGYSRWDIQLVSAAEVGACHNRNRIFVIAYSDSTIPDGKQPTCWADQVGEVVSRQRLAANFPVFERGSNGVTYGLPLGLDICPIGVEKGSQGRDAQLFPNAVQLQSQESNISQVLSSLESYAEVKDCEDIFVLPEDLGGEDLSKNEVFSLIKQVNGSVKVLPSFTKFAYNLVRYVLIKIDKRCGWKAFNCSSMTQFLEEKCELFDRAYSTLQKEWKAGKLEVDILGVKVATLAETQAREFYPILDKPALCKTAFRLASNKAKKLGVKLTTKLLAEYISNYTGTSKPIHIKTNCRWVGGPEGTRHYRVKLFKQEINLHDSYTETAVAIEKMSAESQQPPEQLLIKGLLGYIANTNQTTHAGAVATVVDFLQNRSDIQK